MMNLVQTIASVSEAISLTSSPFLPRGAGENEPVGFMLDDRGHGFHLLFVTAAMMTQSPFTPMWVLNCGDRATLHAVARWAAVRRQRWTDWATLFGALGSQDFDAYMRQLLADEPAMHVTATKMRFDDQANEVVFSQILESGTTVSSGEVVRHRFASADEFDTFKRWLNADGIAERAEQLVSLAFAEGTDPFGAMVDELARPKAMSRQQRRQMKRRSVH